LNNEDEADLVRVGPGTPPGEVFRRYWLPVEASCNLGGSTSGSGSFSGARNPVRVRVLGEDLVLFRDASGRPGLLAEHCSHRGTSLSYGRVEEDALRCLYHGWAFDRQGTCVDTPGEPPDSNFKRTINHPAYPCREVGGLVFAYLGPLDRQPAFPRYEELFREDGLRVTGDAARLGRWNAFRQILDNVLDPWHREILHGWFKGVPPRARIHWGRDGKPPTPIKYERTPWGACYVYLASLDRPGRYEYHETHAVWPCQRASNPRAKSMKWAVPVDDRTTRWFGVDFFPFVDGKVPEAALRSLTNPTLTDGNGAVPADWVEQVGQWWNLGHPWRQGQIWEDEVAMASQGVADRGGFADVTRWHPGTSDRGMMLSREVWREQIERVRQGLDPIGVSRDPGDDQLIRVPTLQREVDWEEGMRLFRMTVEERAEAWDELASEGLGRDALTASAGRAAR
jgi:5,5'-dehydrodivanillate O-demethylase